MGVGFAQRQWDLTGRLSDRNVKKPPVGLG